MSNPESFRPIEINVTDEHEFRTGVVKHLQLILDQTQAIPDMKKKVDRHDQAYHSAKWVAIPLFALLQAFFKSIFHKLGWWS